MNIYHTSDGKRVGRTYVDYQIRKAKERKLAIQMEEQGYNFCETCKRNDDIPVTNAHIISVKECLESGRSELAWSLDNLILEGMQCHKIRDNNLIKSGKCEQSE
jgi:tRNA 2-selenouridine synthase SelU